MQKAVLQWLKRHNIEHWRMPLGPVLQHRGNQVVYTRNPLKGFPDIAGVLTRGPAPGRFWAIELKTKTGRMSREQRIWAFRLKLSGAAVAVIRSIEELEAFFQALKEVPKKKSACLAGEIQGK